MTPATLRRLVGVAPSTLSGRLTNLIERGWVRRVPSPGPGQREWRLRLTSAGRKHHQAAIPLGTAAFQRLDSALRDRHVDLLALRHQVQVLSVTLRSLLPDR